MAEGVIYILINEAMPGYVKFGKTLTTVEQRMRELDTTGVPLPFECFYAARVADVDFVERRLQDAFADARIRPRREFFRIDPERVQSALELAGGADVTPRDDVVEEEADRVALNEAREQRGRFNFRMVEIPVGAVLTFTKDENVTCTVAAHNKVEFEGEIMSLSAAALIAVHRLGYSWNAVSGPVYWEYEGQTLDDRRREMEEGE